MTIGFLFWLLMVLWLLFGLWVGWPANTADRRAFLPLGSNFLLFILLFLLGWAVFGFVIQSSGKGGP